MAGSQFPPDGVSLREYIEQLIAVRNSHVDFRFEQADRAIQTALNAVAKQSAASDAAVDKAAAALKATLDVMVKQSMDRFPTRFDIEPMQTTITALTISAAELKGKANQSAVNDLKTLTYISLGLAALGLGLRIFGI